MPTLTEAKDVGDLVGWEGPQQYSRKVVTIAAGSGALNIGAVLGEVTATEKFVPSPATGADGSQVASAVLLTPVDATAADAQAIVLKRLSIVRSFGLEYDASVDTAPEIADKHAQLEAVGIIVNPSA